MSAAENATGDVDEPNDGARNNEKTMLKLMT